MKSPQANQASKARDYISFSEFKKWSLCPYARKLSYVDNIKLFNGNSYTAFGEAMHQTIEELYSPLTEVTTDAAIELFKSKLVEKLNDTPSRIHAIESDMPMQGERILSTFKEDFSNYFGEGYTIFSIEEELYENIDSNTRNFKGFIDMVIVDSEGYYNIVDWKTCSWGWNAKKKSDPMYVYQLSFYKNFFCQKHSIDPSLVRTHFGLLKRTAAKNNVEIFPVTNGKVRINNAIAALSKAMVNMDHGPTIKNRLSCSQCEYHNTEHCT